LESFSPADALGEPGKPPYTRGVYPNMYRGRLWTMRQYAGFGDAAETNKRFRYLLDQGQTGLSVAFDLPTQMGYDSDHAMAMGEVGKVGVAIDTVDDLHRLLAEIPLNRVTTSMTINSTAAILLAMYLVVAEEQGVAWSDVGGTIQNDLLKEYIARGTYIYPVQPSLRLTTDIFAFCRDNVPGWNTISISGYHIREAGSTAAQELAFTMANAKVYVQKAIEAGLDVDDFAPRLSFFFNAHSNLFEEVAKFRAARRLWYKIMTEEFGAKHPKSALLRFHTQTAGSTLTAQQPFNNVVRTTIEALSAVLGGTQSLHTNSMDEALGLPTQDAARVALRTQQILAEESGVADVIDPLAGSYFVESLTNELEERARAYFDEIEERGGMVACIEGGWVQDEIHRAAYAYQRAVEKGEATVVGVNRYEIEEPEPTLFSIDPALETAQVARLTEAKANRDQDKARTSLEALTAAAQTSNTNLVPLIVDAVRFRASLGEISDALRGVFGTFDQH
ncbi:MAG: methylmalonyl-CoA mutase, partial [Candidatus Eisenbacteria bacterium]|nr:methylmalonyl-CoA mutase [Candidatus Eisenbacteria bacterium]